MNRLFGKAVALLLVCVALGCGTAWAVDVTDTQAPAPIAATPDTVLAGQLPGAAQHEQVCCARVAGPAVNKAFGCDPAAHEAAANAPVDKGVVGEAQRADGSVVTYAQVFEDAVQTGSAVVFWAGDQEAPEDADYALYVPVDAADGECGDFRMATLGEDARASIEGQLGRDDFLAVGFIEQGPMPAETELYVRASAMFGNGTYVDVYEVAADGTLAEMVTGLPVTAGYVRLAPASRGSYVLVNASGEVAAGVTTGVWAQGIQVDNAMSGSAMPMWLVAILVAVVLAVLFVVVRAVRATRHSKGFAGTVGYSGVSVAGGRHEGAPMDVMSNSVEPEGAASCRPSTRKTARKGKRGRLS